jgi:hypothetical protein
MSMAVLTLRKLAKLNVRTVDIPSDALCHLRKLAFL